MRPITLVLFSLCAACEGASVDDTPCVELFPSECAQEPACTVVEGYVVAESGDAPCVEYTGDTVGLGCDAEGRECLFVQTLGAPAEDPLDCYLFTNSCIPHGWVECEEVSDIPLEC
jgi:hypothetical protein